MQAAPETQRRAGRAHAAQRGFTLAAVLLSIVVFTISIVGVVAVQRATLASQENAMQMRAAQRIAQHEIEEFKAVGFNEHVAWDFLGTANPNFPYDDLQVVRTAPYRGAPVDVDWSSPGAGDPIPPGMRPNHYRVVRRMNVIPNGVVPAGDVDLVNALHFDVWVLWIDHNPSFPPPAAAQVQTLVPENIDPTSAAFQPWAKGVHLSTVRANDGSSDSAAAGTGATGAP